jgi:hypothetical protein
MHFDRSRLSAGRLAQRESDDFIQARPLAAPWKGRDMDEDLGTAFRRSDESEASLVIPLRQRALESHLLQPLGMGLRGFR